MCFCMTTLDTWNFGQSACNFQSQLFWTNGTKSWIWLPLVYTWISSKFWFESVWLIISFLPRFPLKSHFIERKTATRSDLIAILRCIRITLKYPQTNLPFRVHFSRSLMSQQNVCLLIQFANIYTSQNINRKCSITVNKKNFSAFFTALLSK